MSKDNTAFWGIAAIIGAGFAVAIGSSREKDSLLKKSRADNVIRILGNGVIFLDRTQVTLDDIASTTKLLNTAILIPHDLEDFQTGKQTLERVQQLLRNKSILFEIIKYFRFQSSDEDDFIIQTVKHPIQITLTDSDLAINAFDHKTDNEKILGILWTEGSNSDSRLLLQGIEGGIYSNAKTFYDFIVKEGVSEFTVIVPIGQRDLFDEFLLEAPPSIGMISEEGIAITENVEELPTLLDLMDAKKEQSNILAVELLHASSKDKPGIEFEKTVIDNEILEIGQELEEIAETTRIIKVRIIEE